MLIRKKVYCMISFQKITRIKKVGINIIGINFDTFQGINEFVSNNKELPNNWLIYIPNFRILRTGVVRGRGGRPSLTVEDVKGITWPGKSFEMINVERLKYLSRDTNTLMDSNSVKITFNSSLLPEYIYIWKVKLRVNH